MINKPSLHKRTPTNSHGQGKSGASIAIFAMRKQWEIKGRVKKKAKKSKKSKGTNNAGRGSTTRKKEIYAMRVGLINDRFLDAVDCGTEGAV